MNKTQQNLLKAFAGESQARNKYQFFAEKAREEGYENIAAIFDETADNEKAHARRLMEFIGGYVETEGQLKIKPRGSLLENLKEAMGGEHYENTIMYPEFSKIAKEEGFDEISKMFKEIGEVEEYHEARYKKLIADLENDKIFKKDSDVQWKCRNCGYVHTGKEAPDTCPACGYARAYYEIRCENY